MRNRTWAHPGRGRVTTGPWPWRPRSRSTVLAEFALKGLKRLDPGTRAALVEEAAALGIVADRADRLIGRICRRLDITREAGSVAPSPNPGLGFDAPRRDGRGQRSPAVHAAALPELRGRDRVEPGGAQGRLGAMSALRGIAAVGLSGLPAHPVGRRAAMPMRVPHGDARAGPSPLRSGPAVLPHLRPDRGDRASRTGPGAGPELRQGSEWDRQGPAAAGGPRPRQAGLRDGAGRRQALGRPRGDRGLEPIGRTRNRPRSRRPGPS